MTQERRQSVVRAHSGTNHDRTNQFSESLLNEASGVMRHLTVQLNSLATRVVTRQCQHTHTDIAHVTDPLLKQIAQWAARHQGAALVTSPLHIPNTLKKHHTKFLFYKNL